MAKSKNGGSRAYIRGRIGSDVYSIGKNGKGERQQVVRSLAESVANPRTQNQMFGRMVMSTVMQAVSGLSVIIDHSFDGIAKGQPSISEFIRTNYALVKQDAEDNPQTNNTFGLQKYQEKGIRPGRFVVSKGSQALPVAVTSNIEGLSIALAQANQTVGGLKAALGLSADGYITYVGITSDKKALYCRVKLDTTLADTTTITSENVASLFTLEGNVSMTPSLGTNAIVFALAGGIATDAYGVIVSELVDGAWKHNNCTLSATAGINYSANVALPTYPTGAEQFLNGGDL